MSAHRVDAALRDALTAAGLPSLRALARAAAIPLRTFNRYRVGSHDPSPAHLRRLADVLGVSPDVARALLPRRAVRKERVA